LEVTVILENTSGDSKIKGIHGLSFLIKKDSDQILYDFGPKNHLYQNASILGIDLNQVNIAVLSHNHMDHGGDLSSFLKKNNTASIHTNTDLKEQVYSNFIFSLKVPVGVSIDQKMMHRLQIHNHTEEIAPGIVLLKLSKYTNQSTINKSLFIKENGKYSQDTFNHESALLIFDKGEIVVFCSCSHHGVVEILNDVNKQYPQNRIKAFIGGFHMFNPMSKVTEEEVKIYETAEKLMGNNIMFYTGHCTGDVAFQILHNKLGERITQIATGMKIIIN
jgi:7,8-dihydropterin-6-yl-methyl-4-(beta-D-ribofuranosyl)aminobenzene 5'-phosphate synthase